MKKSSIGLVVIAVLFSCSTQTKKISKEEIVHNLIEYTNQGEPNKIDSITSESFKLLTDSTVTEKNDYLKLIIKPVANRKIQISEIELKENLVRTKEIITDDVINYLKIEPIERTREYHFNDSNQVKSIYNLESYESPDYKNIQKKFILWANQEYPDLVKDILEKAKKEENFDEERRYLLTKLVSVGLQALDEVKTELPKESEPKIASKPKKKAIKKSIYIQPDSSFLNSYVVTYFGQNAFPFGEYTVQEFKSAVASTILSNGKNPTIKGWTKNDNVYTLHTTFKEGTFQFIFEHMLNREGKMSLMRGKAEGLPIDGVNMYRFVPSLTK